MKLEKKYWIILIVITIILLGSIFLYFSLKSNIKEKKYNNIYEKAYDDIGFKEDTSLSKVYCELDASNGSEVKNKKIIIYYFDNNKLVTHIIHNEVILSEEYMDYYDEMYDSHKKSLDKNYNYKNVRINIEKGSNEILDTIIVTRAEGEKMLNMPIYNSSKEAENAAISRGYSCK